MQMEYLKSKNISYDEILVDENPEAAQKMIDMSGQLGVPFTVITRDDGTQENILGFDRKRLDEIIATGF